jgi:outer membrane receptor for ferrienterochelin and colicins
MSRYAPSYAPLFALLLLATRAAAEETPEAEAVDDLDLVKLLNVEVSTATKTAESIEDAPAVITVVTREEIQRWGYRSVAEVLERTVGFFVVDDHILPNTGVRGMIGGLGAESGVIKVMIDGRSVAYRTTSGNWLGTELVPLTSVQQIEIIRGPASALYGADAFLGVVNIITVSPDLQRPLRIRADAGHAGGNPGGTVDATTGGQIGDFDVLFGTALELADRSGLLLPQESPAPTLPSTVGTRRSALNLERRSLALQGRVGYRPNEYDRLVLSAYASGLERGGDFAHWAQLTNGSNAEGQEFGTVVGLQQLRLTLDGLAHVSDQVGVALQSTYFQGGILDSDRVEIGSDLFYVERNQSYYGVDTNLELRFIPSEGFNAIVGTEAVIDHESLLAPSRIDRATGVVAAGSDASLSERVTLTNLGAFLSVNYRVVEDWLKLTGGLRYDRHSQYGDQLTGRLGATSRWSPSIVAKLLYGSAFKAPSPYLLYAAPLRPGDVVGNTALKPQHIQTAEYQMSWQPSRFFGVTSGVAYSWLFDKAEFTPQGINQTARNVASQRSLSSETRLDARHYDDYSVFAAFEWVLSTRDLGQEGYAASLVGSRNVVYPPWIARVGATVDLPSVPAFPLELGSQAQLVGPRRAADTTIVETGADVTFDPYVVVDTFLSTRDLYLFAGHETRMALRARNLLATRGPNPGPAGFEYPLPPGELFLQMEHTY